MSLTMSAATQNRVTFKVVIVGERGVGKTSLALRYVKGIFNKCYAVTVGIEFYSKILKVNEEECCLQLWDTAGQQSFRSLVKSFYNQASCVIFTYCDPALMQKSVSSYLNETSEHASKEVSIFVARTKTDLQPLSQDERTYLQELEGRGDIAGWMEVSAKQGINIDNFFEKVAQNLVDKFNQNIQFRQVVEPKKLTNSILLTKQSYYESSNTSQKRKKSKKCCE